MESGQKPHSLHDFSSHFTFKPPTNKKHSSSSSLMSKSNQNSNPFTEVLLGLHNQACFTVTLIDNFVLYMDESQCSFISPTFLPPTMNYTTLYIITHVSIIFYNCASLKTLIPKYCIIGNTAYSSSKF